MIQGSAFKFPSMPLLFDRCSEIWFQNDICFVWLVFSFLYARDSHCNFLHRVLPVPLEVRTQDGNAVCSGKVIGCDRWMETGDGSSSVSPRASVIHLQILCGIVFPLLSLLPLTYCWTYRPKLMYTVTPHENYSSPCILTSHHTTNGFLIFFDSFPA